MKLTVHRLDIVPPAVEAMVTSIACTEPSDNGANYPGLPPIIEISPEVKTSLVNKIWTCTIGC